MLLSHFLFLICCVLVIGCNGQQVDRAFMLGSNEISPLILYPTFNTSIDWQNIANLSEKCKAQLMIISAEHPASFEKIKTASGKSMGDTGDFWQCSQTEQLHYCLATLDLTVETNSTAFTCKLQTPQCNIGICTPSDCDSADIVLLLREILPSEHSPIVPDGMNFTLHCQVDTSVRGNPRSILGIAGIVFIIGFTLFCSALYALSTNEWRTWYQRVDVDLRPKKPAITETAAVDKLELRHVATGPSDFSLVTSIQHQGGELSINSVENDGLIEIPDNANENNIDINGDSDDMELLANDLVLGESNTHQNNLNGGHFHHHDDQDIEHEEDAPLLVEKEPESLKKDTTNNNTTTNGTEVDVDMHVNGDLYYGDDDDAGCCCELVEKVIPKPVMSIAQCWSISDNWNRLYNPIPGSFGALNALRFFSICWVVWGHTYFFWAQTGPANPGYVYNHVLTQFWAQAAISGVFAVDSFFFLSGFLGCYFLYERLLAGKRMEWFLIYFHRLWRILPIYSFIIFIYMTMIPVLGDGPFWFNLKNFISVSSPNCWYNLLFINNFFPVDSSLQCVGWGWFLAVDMQFFLISPLIIFIHYKKPAIGWLILAIWLVQDLSTSVGITVARDYSPNIVHSQPNFFAHFYQRPYVRASPYIIGLSCGYLLHYLKNRPTDFRIPSLVLNAGYGLAFSTMFVVVFSVYWDNQWDTFENAIYLGFSRFAWGLSIAYLMVTMFLGYGGVLRSLFYARCWEPLAKLTYGIYLSHPLFMWLFYFNQWDYLFYQNRNMWYFYIAHFFCAIVFSVISYLLIEKPFMNLEPIIIKSIAKLLYKIIRKPLPKALQ